MIAETEGPFHQDIEGTSSFANLGAELAGFW